MKATLGALACLFVGGWCGHRAGYAAGFIDAMKSFSAILKEPR